MERDAKRLMPEAHDLFRRVPAPVGTLLLTAADRGLTGVYFETHRYGPPAPEVLLPDAVCPSRSAATLLAAAAGQLDEYFTGARTTFDLPLVPRGTPFQRRVWHALSGIPFGSTISYAELARRIDVPRAVRAVGGANARNPLSIIVPCHRVVRRDGSLTGFGGGIERKRWLLRHEAAWSPLTAVGGTGAR